MSNPSIIVNGRERFLACLPPKPDFGGLPSFLSSPANRLIPRDQWKPVDWSPLGVPVLDQTQNGCVGHGGVSGFWFSWLMAGNTVPPSGFSPTSLYAMINGGRDKGAFVSDAMTSLQNDGVCTMAECPESMIYQSQIPASANETRKRFKLDAAYGLADFDEMGSAIQLGYPVTFGISINGAFQTPPASGVIPSGGWSIGGHCMMAYGMIMINGKWYLLVRNSWGDWCLAGNCMLGEGHFGGRGFEAFANQSVIPDPQDPNKPPVAR